MPGKRRGGFSLIELMVAFGIIGIIAAISIPAYSRYRSNIELKSTVQQVAAALRQARSTATQLADGVTCDAGALKNGPMSKTSPGRFTVFAFKGGIPSEMQSGDAQYLAASTSATNDRDLPNEPVGAAITVTGDGGQGEVIYFRQDGTVYGTSDTTFTFSNGSASYKITLQKHGAVTVTENP